MSQGVSRWCEFSIQWQIFWQIFRGEILPRSANFSQFPRVGIAPTHDAFPGEIPGKFCRDGQISDKCSEGGNVAHR